MSSARQAALNAIKVGDVICGVSGSGQEKLLLVYEAGERTFLARHVTSQTSAEFGRDREALPIPEGGPARSSRLPSCRHASIRWRLGWIGRLEQPKSYPT